MLHRSFVIRTKDNWSRMVAFFKANWSREHPLVVIVSEPRAQRTVEQNDALHATIRQIANEAYVDGQQFSVTAWKEMFRRMYVCNDMIILPDGREVERHRSTTELSVGEMSELIESIKRYAAENLGLEMQ